MRYLLMAVLCVVGGFVFAAPHRPIRAPARAAAPVKAIKVSASAGTVNAAATVTQAGRPIARSDGGYDQTVFVSLNNCSRQRTLSCVPVPASDAGAATTSYLLDGSAVASPPAAFTALCTFLLGTYTTDLAQIDTKISNALNAPGVQALLVAP